MLHTIDISHAGKGVTVLTLARPEKHNALSAEMMDELTIAANELGADPAVRVVVLAARGRSFCAGGDLGWMRSQFDADEHTRAAEARRLAEMLDQLNRLPKPLIGRVQGNAFGGGIGLMSVCDVVIASGDANFALTETRLGLIPATIAPYVAARMGAAASRRYFGSGRRFTAQQAKNIGLVAECVPATQLDLTLEAEIAPWLECAPGAIADAKGLLREMGATEPDKMRALTERALADRWSSEEARVGVGAFFARADPPWRSPAD